MLHFGLFDLRTDIFILLLLVGVILLQTLLCYKAKPWLRRIPVCLLAGAMLVLIVLGIFHDGWDRVGFLFLAGCAAILMAAAGIGWGIWWIFKGRKRG